MCATYGKHSPALLNFSKPGKTYGTIHPQFYCDRLVRPCPAAARGARSGAPEMRCPGWVGEDRGDSPHAQIPGRCRAGVDRRNKARACRDSFADRADSHRTGGVRRFPTIKSPRVIWVGLRGQIGPLAELERRVAAAMVSLGFKPEERPFKPHLTLARQKPGRSSKPPANSFSASGLYGGTL